MSEQPHGVSNAKRMYEILKLLEQMDEMNKRFYNSEGLKEWVKESRCVSQKPVTVTIE